MPKARRPAKKTAKKPRHNPAKKSRKRNGHNEISVYINSGCPDPNDAPVQPGDFVTFFNEDQLNYLIELTRGKNSKHNPICLFVPAGGGTITIQTDPADPDDKNVTCSYKILDANGSEVSCTQETHGSGPGHSIIIGSGSVDD